MVLSKEDFKVKIDSLNLSDDEKISLLEDIEDSWNDSINEEYKAHYEAEKKEMEAAIANLEAEAASIKAKYKERFFSAPTKEEETIDNSTDVEEKTIIDIKEL